MYDCTSVFTLDVLMVVAAKQLGVCLYVRTELSLCNRIRDELRPSEMYMLRKPKP